MENIDKFESEGYEGTDADLPTSLFEYGLIWKSTGKGDEYKFIFGAAHDGARFTMFDYGFADSIDDYDWADFDEVAKWTSMSKSEWLKQKLPYQIFDLIGYYGFENVFGSSSDPFEIQESKINEQSDDLVIIRDLKNPDPIIKDIADMIKSTYKVSDFVLRNATEHVSNLMIDTETGLIEQDDVFNQLAVLIGANERDLISEIESTIGSGSLEEKKIHKLPTLSEFNRTNRTNRKRSVHEQKDILYFTADTISDLDRFKEIADGIGYTIDHEDTNYVGFDVLSPEDADALEKALAEDILDQYEIDGYFEYEHE